MTKVCPRLVLLGMCLTIVLGTPALFARAAETSVDFARDIRPILTNSCFRCHGPDEETVEAGLQLDTRDHAMAETDSGVRAIVPGKPGDSELIARVSSADEFERMPPEDAGSKLKGAEIELLKAWIQQGAPYARHWSFEPPQRPDIPQDVSDANWVKNAIDRFVLARLDREGLRPSPLADRYAIVRRVSLDLTGLPPTIEEVDRFGPNAVS